MLMDCATILAIVLGTMVVHMGQRARLDWHPQRGLSFLQLGLRELKRLLYCGERLPILQQLPRRSPPKAFASKRKREELDIILSGFQTV
jgi:succinate dehydrogenase flavin-adding protein (antitoxin of CptAB toxin-antitoxin module)